MPFNNRSTSKSKDFILLCKKAGITSTKRQVSKYLNGKGFLFKKLVKKVKNIHLPKEARYNEEI